MKGRQCMLSLLLKTFCKGVLSSQLRINIQHFKSNNIRAVIYTWSMVFAKLRSLKLAEKFTTFYGIQNFVSTFY